MIDYDDGLCERSGGPGRAPNTVATGSAERSTSMVERDSSFKAFDIDQGNSTIRGQ